MKKFLLLSIISFLIIPQITFAVWWNPFTWKIFKRSTEIKTEQTTNVPSDLKNISSEKTEQSSKIDQTIEIEKLKKEVEDLKKKNSTITTKPTTSNKTELKTQTQNSSVPFETWEKLEARFFIDGDQKGWINQSITNSLGEKRYYRKEGNQWVRKNSEAEAAQPYTDFIRPTGAPSSAQLRRLMAMCSLSEEIATTCNSSTFISGYFTNMAFRTLVDDLAIKSAQKLAEQKTQNELAQQRYLLYLQTVNQPAIPTYIQHETYSLPLYTGGLKLEPPQVNSPRKWEIQWTGGGAGFIKDYSSGSQTNFLCDSGRCFTP